MDEFKDILKRLREKKRLDQKALSKLIGVSQQTVSKWESGKSKPRTEEIAKLAGAFPEISQEDWYEKSGRVMPPVRPLTDTLPINLLQPDKFEQFCIDYVKSLYPEVEVHRYGTQGHKQNGIDLYAIFPDKTVLSFQCKRRQPTTSFGPEEIQRIIEDTTFKAGKYFILLTKTASPEARDEMLKYKTKWVLDDIYDISDNIRRLPKTLSLKLVDTYFPGHRTSFLGELEPGPWVTAQEYYSKFLGLFRQDWTLIGRELELENVLQFSNSDRQIHIVNGRGGIGKTKILKEFCDKYSAKNPGKAVLFAISGIPLQVKDLENLPEDAILVIDDAHERIDLTGFLNALAFKGLTNKIILVTRPYGLSKIRSNIANAGFYLHDDSVLTIDSLTTAESTSLAATILESRKANKKLASTIANLSKDCPLITVTAAKILSDNPDLINTMTETSSFQNEVLKRFYDSVTGNIGGTSLSDLSKRLLEVISLIQPISPGRDNTIGILSNILKTEEYLIDKELQYLEDAGILLRRANQVRIVPDLLGDYIRETSSYNSKENRSTRFFESIYQQLPDNLRNNLLINLSQLDWRINSKGIRSTLLDSIWEEITARFKESGIWQRKELLTSLKEISYYQPERMLEITRYAINSPTEDTGIDNRFRTHIDYSDVIEEIPYILRDIAYNIEFINDACDLLWELSKGDNRARNSHPEHPLRILSEMISIRPNKPLVFSDRILDRALQNWIVDPENGVNAFEVIEKLLETADYETETVGYTMTMHPFFISPEAADPIRKKVIDAAKKYLINGDINFAARALRTLTEALHYPRPIGGATIPPKLIKQWEVRIIEVLKQLKLIIEQNELDPILMVQILHDISWHKDYSKSETKKYAEEIEKSMPVDLIFRITRALMDDWGWAFERDRDDIDKSHKLHSTWTEGLAEESLEAYKDNLQGLVELIEERIQKMSSTLYLVNASHNFFIACLAKKSPDFASLLAEHILNNPKTILITYFNTVVSYLQKTSPSVAKDVCERAVLSNEELTRQVAVAFSWGMTAEDIIEKGNLSILKSLVQSKYDSVRLSATKAVSRLTTIDKKLATGLILAIDFNGKKNIAEEVLTEFVHKGEFSINDLTASQLKKISDMLLDCSSIDSYYIENFLRDLSAVEPRVVIELLKNRIIKSTETSNGDEKYSPLPHIFERSEHFKFNQHPEYENILREVRNWVFENNKDKWQYEYFGKDLFKLVAGTFDDRVIKVLAEWIESNKQSAIENSASLLSEANSNFIWSNVDFIVNLLNRAQLFGSETQRRVNGSIYTSLISGGKSGTPGEPFPEDIRLRDEAQRMIESLPSNTSAYKFFEDIKNTALRDIERSNDDRYS